MKKQFTPRQGWYRTLVAAACLTFLFTSCQKESAVTQKENPQTETPVAVANELSEQEVRTQATDFSSAHAKEISTASKDAERQFVDDNDNEKGGRKTLLGLLKRNPALFSAFTAAAEVTRLDKVLDAKKSTLTVFAPVNAAFAALPAPFNSAQRILKIKDKNQLAYLKALVLYHLLDTLKRVAAVPDGRSTAVTAKPQSAGVDNVLYFSKAWGMLGINGIANVVKQDVTASNGVLQVINQVLYYPVKTIAQDLNDNSNFTALVAALTKANFLSVLTKEGNYTLFAAPNSAFAQLPAPYNTAANISGITNARQIDTLTNIVRYHVLSQRFFGWDLGFFDQHASYATPPANKITTVIGFPVGFVKGNRNKGYSMIRPGNRIMTNGVIHVIPNILLP